ncbi:histidine kinase [Ectothiorhodospira sp. PHS-1]|uniref:cache domain-containing protein n=1 Tax=Ectothiorhodospira sp. PHS-1 TaxID=519989 RepID=UPI00024A8912|nr:cache domain-containing protein [Ectothiorhodospira sp. PHS-1]EHQ52459.1 histidine kinase [Ectothiorhodospira sp. PHS-1]
MQIRSQRFKLALLVVGVSLVPLMVMAMSTSQVLRAQVEASLQDALVSIGREVSNLLETYMLQRGDELAVLGEQLAMADDSDRATVLAVYRRHFRHFDYLAVLDGSGRVLAAAGQPLSAGSGDPAGQLRDWSRAGSGGRLLLDVDDQPGTDRQRFVVFLQPLEGGGILVGQVDGARVVTITNRVQIGDTGRATLFNREGRLIGHPDPSRYGSDMSHYPILTPVLRQGRGHPGGEFLSGDGRMKWGLTLALTEMEQRYGVRWGLIVDQTLAELYSPLTRVQHLMWLVSAMVLAVAVLLGIWYASRLVRPSIISPPVCSRPPRRRI